MKNSYKIKTLAALLTVSVFTSCTKDFDELNTNKNTLTADQLDASLAGAAFLSAEYAGIHNGSYSSPGVDDQGTWGIATGIISSTFVQYMNTGYSTDRNAFGGFEARGWLRFYTVAVPALNNAFIAAKDDADATAILKIWKVFMFNQMTDHYGPIPYTEAGNGLPKVAYDSQESIYEDFFKLLDEANTTLSATSTSTVGLYSTSDRIFNGNVDNWRTFGNSLRLRLALRISDVQPEKAKTQAEAAVAAGVMESNSQSATFKVSSITPNNLNMIVNSWGYYMTASMESILKGYNDPRMEKWFAPNEDGIYLGKPAGGLRGQFGTTKFSPFSDALAGDYQNTKSIEIMMASESYLNRAEGALNGWSMDGTAKNLYEKGIEMSMNQWGITDSEAISDYVAGTSTPVVPAITTLYPSLDLYTPPVTVAVSWASTEADQRKQITVQKYLALFPESWESWADLRRTDVSVVYPLLNTDNVDAGVGKSLMKRVIYVTNEYSSNNAAVLDGIVKLGGSDSGGTKLWWDVN